MVAAARKTGAAGLELEAAGDLVPNRLSESGRRELKHLLRSHDLEAAALFAPLRRGLDMAEGLEARVDYLKQVLGLAYDLGPRVVIVQIGQVPAEEKDPRYPFLKGALEELARHGDRIGSRLAIEVGLEPADLLMKFLAGFDTGSLAICYNPGALLSGGFNPYDSLRTFHGRLIHAHARDARVVSVMGRAQEVPIGHGDIDWMMLAGVFEEIDYRGWLVVDGDQIGPAEVGLSVGFLRRIFG